MTDRMRVGVAVAAGERTRAEGGRRCGISRKTGDPWLAGSAGPGGPVAGPAALAARAGTGGAGSGPGAAASRSELGTDETRRPLGAGATGAGRTRAPATAPHRGWCAAVNGDFAVGAGPRGYPLTLSDAASRERRRGQALPPPATAWVRPVFAAAFGEDGRPTRRRTDHGPPFAARGAGGLTPRSGWGVKRGRVPERRAPGRPNQNGRHERRHPPRKAEAGRAPAHPCVARSSAATASARSPLLSARRPARAAPRPGAAARADLSGCGRGPVGAPERRGPLARWGTLRAAGAGRRAGRVDPGGRRALAGDRRPAGAGYLDGRDRQAVPGRDAPARRRRAQRSDRFPLLPVQSGTHLPGCTRG